MMGMMLQRAWIRRVLRGRSRTFAIAVAALFLFALIQPQTLAQESRPPATHVSIDACDGGTTGCKVLPFAQVFVSEPAIERPAGPPSPFTIAVATDSRSRYEAPSAGIEPPPRSA